VEEDMPLLAKIQFHKLLKPSLRSLEVTLKKLQVLVSIKSVVAKQNLDSGITRENLSRIQDVLNEIIQQIAKLESQAVIATKYNELTEKHKFHQAQVWVLKKRDASIVWKKHQSQVEKLVNELETTNCRFKKN